MTKLNVIYEDNHLIVVIKPANILVQKDNTGDDDLVTMVKDYLKEKYHKPGNVYLGLLHRLDRPVGGILIFAKTSKAASRMSKQIANHEVKKGYLAVVNGLVKEKDTLVNYLTREEKIAKVTDKEHGKYASLSYERLATKDNLSLVKIDLKTGRHHQIRVQFAHLNTPLYGDQLYGKQDKLPIALYAYKLEFIHPVTKEELSFTSLPNGGIWNFFDLGAVV